MKITPEYANTTCLMGEGSLCCRYLVAPPSGLSCAKLDADVSAIINARYAAGTMAARGDNCPGFPFDRDLPKSAQ
jgi:hypothetical protein